jgi:hypothetical protein
LPRPDFELTKHLDGDGEDVFGNDAAIYGDVIDHFVQSASFHFFPLQVGKRVGDEVEKSAALTKFFDEKIFCFRRLKNM